MRALLLIRLWAALNLARAGLRWLRRPVHAIPTLLLLGAVVAAFAQLWIDTAPDVSGWWYRPVSLAVTTFAVSQVTLNAWLFPRDLAFTRAEVALVFPAPVSRATLLGARMIVAQPLLLAGAAVLSVLIPVRGFDSRLALLGGLHVLLTFLHLNALAASVACVVDPATGRAGPARPLVVAALGVALVVTVWSLRSVPLGLDADALGDLVRGDDAALREASARVGRWAEEGPQAVALAPFRALAELVAPSPLVPIMPEAKRAELRATLDALLSALPPADRVWTGLVGLSPVPGWRRASRLPPALGLVLLPLLYVLLGRKHVAEAALEATAVRELRREQQRAGTLRSFALGALPPPPLSLDLLEGPVWAIAWKNLAGLTRVPASRHALDALLLVGLALAVAHLEALSRCVEMAILSVQASIGLTLVVAGDSSAFDLRAGLVRPAWLRTLPLPGWQVFLGEVLANTLAPWAVTCLLLALQAILVGGLDGAPSPALRVLGALGASVAALPVIGCLVIVTNGAGLVWPRLAVFPPRTAIDGLCMYVLMALRMLVLGLASIPAALVGGAIALAGLATIGPAALPLAGVAFATLLGAALVPMVALAGRRLDAWEPAS